MLDTFNTLLDDTFGPLGPVFMIGAIGLVLILIAVPLIMNQRRDPMDKLRDQTRSESKAGRAGKADLRSGRGTNKLDKYAEYLEPKDEKELAGMQLKLLQAGYKEKTAVRTFHFAQFVLGVGFIVLGLLFALVLGPDDMSPVVMILTILVPGLVGYYLPKYWIEKRRQERQVIIEQGFPDALDLMLVCVEAGQSLDQSIARIAAELRAGYPPLAEEFEIVANEMKVGKDRVIVLKDMSERAGVQDVASFVTVLIQSASFGTSIADALRVYAEEMRDKRVMRAEEKANKLPTKLTLGTMMFTIPPLLIILIGPSVYDIMENLKGLNSL